jgi:hypothetical protein
MKTFFTIFLILIMQSAWAQTSIDTSKVYTFVEEQPCFLDSITNECSTDAFLMKAIRLNITLPEKDFQWWECEKVNVEFIVEKDGSLSNFEIKKGGECLGEQVIKFLQNGPKWKPGKQNGALVRVKYWLFLRFKIG